MLTEICYMDLTDGQGRDIFCSQWNKRIQKGNEWLKAFP